LVPEEARLKCRLEVAVDSKFLEAALGSMSPEVAKGLGSTLSAVVVAVVATDWLVQSVAMDGAEFQRGLDDSLACPVEVVAVVEGLGPVDSDSMDKWAGHSAESVRVRLVRRVFRVLVGIREEVPVVVAVVAEMSAVAEVYQDSPGHPLERSVHLAYSRPEGSSLLEWEPLAAS
jgi:hypothetical protein